MKIIIIGVPLQKQSARFAKMGKFMRSYQPKEVTNWTAQAKIQVINQLPEPWTPIEEPIIIKKLTFVFPPLKSWSKKKRLALENGIKIFKDKKPDLDNLQKNLFDVCNKLVWSDDAQIVRIESMEKIHGLQPRIELVIENGQ